MKRTIVLVGLMLGLSSVTYGQDTILSTMKEKSEIIAHVKVLDIQGGEVEEVGVVEWNALCRVIQPIKGDIKKDSKVRFRFNRCEFKGHRESPLVEKEKEYVIFLAEETGGIRFPSDDELEAARDLVDRWVGVMPYNYFLVDRLVNYL